MTTNDYNDNYDQDNHDYPDVHSDHDDIGDHDDHGNHDDPLVDDDHDDHDDHDDPLDHDDHCVCKEVGGYLTRCERIAASITLES